MSGCGFPPLCVDWSGCEDLGDGHRDGEEDVCGDEEPAGVFEPDFYEDAFVEEDEGDAGDGPADLVEDSVDVAGLARDNF